MALHPDIGSLAEALRTSFQSAQPFRHVVMERFLDEAFCERLIAAFPSFDMDQARNELGAIGRKSAIPHIARLGPIYQEFDRLMRDPDFLATVGRIAGIDDLVYDPDYAGGGTHENLSGQDLDPHVDFNYHPARPLHRRLNLIVFLNSEWREEWGGCLELLRDPWSPDRDGTTTIVPIANRAVLFETTETSWHGFKRIQLPPERSTLSRRSVAVYFYTRKGRATASHGTIYAPRPLPEHLQSGHSLSDADVLELRTLIARRDAQIRYLYERELEFSQVISGITNSPSFKLGRILTWPLRKLRGAKGP
jgi:hypothetical protein